MIKYSRQREAIKTYLNSTKEHPTADTVYLALRDEIPNISLGTVYRNLRLLEEMGEIRRLNPGIGPERFDAFMDPHYHLVCEKCGEVTDLDMPQQIGFEEEAEKVCGGHITHHTVLFYGWCQKCLSESEKNPQ